MKIILQICIILLVYFSSIQLKGQTITSIQTLGSRCNASGSATVNVIGGTAPYFYSIKIGTVVSASQTSNVLNALPAGTHTVYVADINNIQTSSTVTISGNYSILDFSLAITSTSCGLSNGSIVATKVSSTGIAPFTYEITSPISVPPQASNTFTGLPAGNYLVRMNDSCGNFQTRSINLTSNNSFFQIEPYISSKVGCDVFRNIFYITVRQPDISASPYSISITNSNGIGNLTYTTNTINTMLSNGGGAISVLETFTVTGYNITSVISVTNGCGNVSTRTIKNPENKIKVISRLNGCSDIYHYVVAADPYDYLPYTYLSTYTINITNSTGNIVATSNNANTPFINLSPGSYTATITDACGTTASSAFVESNLTPEINYILVSYSTCTDSTIGMYFNFNNMTQIKTLTLINGPSIIKSAKTGFQYLANMTYPIDLPTANMYYTYGGFGVGEYTISATDTCGRVAIKTFTIEPYYVDSYSLDFNYVKDCSYNNTINISTSDYNYRIDTLINISTGDTIYTGYNYGGFQNYSHIALPGTYVLKSERVMGDTNYYMPNIIGFCGPIFYDTLVIPPYKNVSFSQVNKGYCTPGNYVIQGIADSTSGVPPYSYAITSGPQTFPTQASNTFSVNLNGIYTLLISDACGNSFNTNVSIDNSPSTILFSGRVCLSTTAKLFVVSSPFYSYKWERPDGSFYYGDTLAIGPMALADFGVYKAEQYVNIGGCTNTVTITRTLTPSSPPTLLITSPTTCEGVPSISSISGANSYTWSPTVTSNNSNSSNVTLNPSVTTTYTINSLDNYLCAYTVTTTLSVLPNPTVAIQSVSSLSICSGNSSIIAPSGGLSYTLSPGNVAGTSFTVMPLTTTQYTIKGTSAAGCSATKSITITVNLNPTITINTPFICVNSSATLTANGANTYMWDNGSTLNPLIVNPTSTMVYSVTGTNTTGCVSTQTAMITVNPTPTITINAPFICINSSATLTANGANTYTWDNGSTVNPLIINPTTTTVYSVTGANATGCISTQTTMITVNPTPSITINAPVICTISSATLTANGANTYMWDNGSTTNPLIVNPTSTTVYSVTGTNATGCISTQTTMITVNPTPSITINAPVICTISSATLTANGANTYMWDNGSTTNPLIVNPTSTTVYSVTGTNTTGCVSTQTTVVIVNALQASFTGMENLVVDIETELTLVNTSTAASNIAWSTCYQDALTTETITVPLLDTGICCVKLYVFENICVDSVEKCVRVTPKTFLEVPNVFTPNGDNKNDVFTLVAINIGDIEMLIYDRWGLKIFEAKTIGNIKWDGKTTNGSPATDGTYFYILKAKSLDNKAYDLKGTINVFK